MKSYILVFGLLTLCNFSFGQQAQLESATTISLFELQTNEFVAHYNLDDATKIKVMEINATCENKNQSLMASGMSQAIINEGIAYNEDWRYHSLKDLLSPKMQETVFDFMTHSQYNQMVH